MKFKTADEVFGNVKDFKGPFKVEIYLSENRIVRTLNKVFKAKESAESYADLLLINTKFVYDNNIRMEVRVLDNNNNEVVRFK